MAESKATAAERAAERAAAAEQAADEADLAAKREEAEDAGALVCPHCRSQMEQHGESKGNAWHCNACGGCWVHRGSAWFSREGHTAPAGWSG